MIVCDIVIYSCNHQRINISIAEVLNLKKYIIRNLAIQKENVIY